MVEETRTETERLYSPYRYSTLSGKNCGQLLSPRAEQTSNAATENPAATGAAGAEESQKADLQASRTDGSQESAAYESRIAAIEKAVGEIKSLFAPEEDEEKSDEGDKLSEEEKRFERYLSQRDEHRKAAERESQLKLNMEAVAKSYTEAARRLDKECPGLIQPDGLLSESARKILNEYNPWTPDGAKKFLELIVRQVILPGGKSEQQRLEGARFAAGSRGGSGITPRNPANMTIDEILTAPEGSFG